MMKTAICIPVIALLVPVAIAAVACWCVIMLSLVVAVSPIILVAKVSG